MVHEDDARGHGGEEGLLPGLAFLLGSASRSPAASGPGSLGREPVFRVMLPRERRRFPGELRELSELAGAEDSGGSRAGSMLRQPGDGNETEGPAEP